ncbi:MAG: efflux RND transporter periplasmic adaptor subunit [Candidatus Pacebacteria bacterium]|nr:efflux RND transporter periplasmic adaptor subunit [Candidatus Paceibacterota bacterium]
MHTRTWFFAVVALACGVSLWWVLSNRDVSNTSYETSKVERGPVRHVVSVTGHVEPLHRLELSFPVGGRLSEVSVSEGDIIARGAIVASLEYGDSMATLHEREAQLAREQARYGEIIAPLRIEARGVEEATLAQTEQALRRAEDTVYTTISRAFVVADDAIHEKADELFDKTSGAPKFGIRFSRDNTTYVLQADSATSVEINDLRRVVGDTLLALKARTNTREDPIHALRATEADLVLIERFLTTLAETVNRYLSDDTSSQTVYESFQSSVASARSAINTVRSEVATAQTNYTTAVTTHERAVRARELAYAGASTEALGVQSATIEMARRAVLTARARLDDTVLTAPIAGTITTIMSETGEAVAPFQTIVELLTEGAYEIETYIPEADIADVKLGDQARITFDAFGKSDVFSADVVRIALSETMREGVPTYKTTLVITDAPDDVLVLRPGMTADVDISTDERKDVLQVPVRSVMSENGRTYVRIATDAGLVERDVTVGLRGSEGTIEIVSGLAEGEEVVLFVKE